MDVDSSAGETHTAPYRGEQATTTLQPSKHRVSEHIAQQPINDQLDLHAKPSALRRRAEVVHAPNEHDDNNQETEVNDTREEELVRQVEQLMAEIQVQNVVLRNVVPPPPYTDGPESPGI